MLKIVLYLIATVAGIIFIKIGSADFSATITSMKLSITLNLYLFLGLLFYLISFTLWVFVLKENKLSFIVPLTTGISQILILLSALTIFSERLKVTNIIGVFIIIIGVIIINL